MAINNYANYIPRFNNYSSAMPTMQPMPQQYDPAPQPSTNIQWITGGIASVGAIQTPANSMFCFFDSNEPKLYFKSVDGNGKPNIKIYEYTEYNPEASQNENTFSSDNFATKEQLTEISEQLSKQITDLRKSLNDFKSKIGNVNKRETGGVKSNG